jgi:hypothetical protein
MKIAEGFIVQITIFVDGIGGMGDSRMFPLPLKQNYLIWGVSFILIFIFITITPHISRKTFLYLTHEPSLKPPSPKRNGL